MAGTVYLMYHELELTGRRPCRTEPGYLRYVVKEEDFRSHLDQLVMAGFDGLSVGQALVVQPDDRPKVALTFDDGSETDLLVAAPLLRNIGYNATFYITVGFLNQPGYLTSSQVRELHDSGFEIGCHSMTHAFLTECSPRQLQVEIVESRDNLQNQIGDTVVHLSCPGGRWNAEVAKDALAAGYQSVATSRIGVNGARPDRLRLRRIPILRGMTATTVRNLSQGKGVLQRRTGDVVRGAAKSLLGNARYEAVRALALRSAR